MFLLAATAVARADMAWDRFDRAPLGTAAPESVSALVAADASGCQHPVPGSAGRAITLDRPAGFASPGAAAHSAFPLSDGRRDQRSVPPAQVTALSAPTVGLRPEDASSSSENTLSLPPAPDGDTLCLSGLLSLGALQTLRRARQVHLHLPEWYHADAAHHQVGHAVALDLVSGFDLLAVRPFDLPSDLLRPAPTIRQRIDEHPLRCESQSILLTEAPRGPPA